MYEKRKRTEYLERNCTKPIFVNPSPHPPILGSSNSAANKDMMPKILTNGDAVF